MRTKRAQTLFCALALLAISGCTTLSPYVPANDEKTASLRLLSTRSVAMCRAGTLYSVSAPDGGNVVRIPVGERISVGTYMSYEGYNVSYSCYPFLSFLPKEGETYVVHNFIRGNQCFIELVREDKTKPTGVVFEPSVGRRDCFKKS